MVSGVKDFDKGEPRPKKPEVGHYLIESSEYGAQWFRIGLLDGEQLFAAHTRSGTIKRFAVADGLKLIGRTQQNRTPCWGKS